LSEEMIGGHAERFRQNPESCPQEPEAPTSFLDTHFAELRSPCGQPTAGYLHYVPVRLGTLWATLLEPRSGMPLTHYVL
jgi:hypothetical protein